eukprot:5824-Heterococcus_DN1.PRE.1
MCIAMLTNNNSVLATTGSPGSTARTVKRPTQLFIVHAIRSKLSSAVYTLSVAGASQGRHCIAYYQAFRNVMCIAYSQE